MFILIDVFLIVSRTRVAALSSRNEMQLAGKATGTHEVHGDVFRTAALREHSQTRARKAGRLGKWLLFQLPGESEEDRWVGTGSYETHSQSNTCWGEGSQLKGYSQLKNKNCFFVSSGRSQIGIYWEFEWKTILVLNINCRKKM